MTSLTSPSIPAHGAGPNCYQCRHFAVSWDPKLPYACRLMGFKSRALPAIEVLRADGLPCQGFSSKSSSPAAVNGAMAGRAGSLEPELAPVPERADVLALSTFRRLA